MALTLAPSYNQPTVTSGPHGFSALASAVISGSPGWLREKRVGVAETAAGASQTSTAALDLTGSTRYRYPGVPSAIGSPSNQGQYAATDLQPGGVASSHWPFAVEFVTSSPQVAFRYNAPTANPSLGRILVDGLPITDTVGSATATAGSGYYVLLTFPDNRSRTITVIGGNATQGRWGGCAVASGYSITKPTDTQPIMAVISDSYTRGAGSVGTVDTAGWRLAWELGYGRAVCLAAVGGTGIIYNGSGTDAASFDGRIADVMALNPAVVLILGGRNDSDSGLQAALAAQLDTIGSTPLRVVASSASEASQSAVRAAMAAAAASRGVAYIDATIDALPKLDAVHPTQGGHNTLAAELLAEWPAASISGTLAATLPSVTGSSSGQSVNPGSLAATPAALTATIVGAQVNPGTLATATPTLSGSSISGGSLNSGTLDTRLPLSTAAIAGTATNPGTLTGALPKLLAQISDQTVNTGVLNGVLPGPTAAITGQSINPATLDVGLPILTGAASGTSTNLGTMTAVLPRLDGQLVGSQLNAATLIVILPLLRALIGETKLHADLTIHTGPASYTRITAGPATRRAIHPGRTL